MNIEENAPTTGEHVKVGENELYLINDEHSLFYNFCATWLPILAFAFVFQYVFSHLYYAVNDVYIVSTAAAVAGGAAAVLADEFVKILTHLATYVKKTIK
ncbi:MAG TPA: hypothetical protein VFM68_02865 [Candidatus Saccharimonadales bacterium]|nr:hypothetical protein [Candidatus Saccharimonadales bacterium]